MTVEATARDVPPFWEDIIERTIPDNPERPLCPVLLAKVVLEKLCVTLASDELKPIIEDCKVIIDRNGLGTIGETV